METGKYIYGLDLSMSNTGVTIVDSETMKIVHVSSITTDTNEFNKIPMNYKHGKRLRHHFEEINKLIEQYPPKVAVIERGFSRFNNATQILFRVHGVYTLAFSEVPNIYYTPKAVKDTIYKGNAGKDELAEIISKRLKIQFANEDESDSTAVALTHMILTEKYPWKKVLRKTKKDILNEEKRAKKAKEKKKTK